MKQNIKIISILRQGKIMNSTFNHGFKATYHDDKHRQIEMIKDAIDGIRKVDKLNDETDNVNPTSTKKDLDKYVSSMMIKSKQKKGIATTKNIIKLQGICNNINENLTESSFKLKNMKSIQCDRLNRKIEKLKNRILPQEITVQNKIQKQLKQIIDINNKRSSGHLVHKSDNIPEIWSTNHSKKKSKYDQSQIISNYWSKLQHQSKISKSAFKAIKENRINILINKSICSEEEMKEFNQTTNTFFNKLPLQQNTIRKQKFHLSRHQPAINQLSHSATPSNSLDCSFGQQNQTNPLEMSLINRRSYLNTRSKSILDKEVTRYFKSKQQKKIFLKSINKDYIQKQTAINVYSFAKGAYSLDPSDVEGQILSLNKFNEAKNDFLTLNEFYKTVKKDLQPKSYDKKTMLGSINNDNTFKTLVQINEIQNKIPKSQLQKLMKKSNLVK